MGEVLLKVRHVTTYRYREPVRLGVHQLLLRPRESCQLRIRDLRIETSPPAHLAWSQDVMGNTRALATFQDDADKLEIDCRSIIALNADPWPVFDITAAASSYPFTYSDEEWTDLGSLAARQYTDDTDRLLAWAQSFIASPETDTLSLLKDVNAGVNRWVTYQSRDDEGTQSPLQTLDRRWGSCRDLATLFVEAVRALGFGARVVSGYVHDPERTNTSPSGTTHAWADVFVPGAGWITFDPTFGRMGSAHLIPVAVARDIRLAMPVSGQFFGPSAAHEGLSVTVDVTALPECDALGSTELERQP